jgi:carbonic anhydrase
MDLTMMMESLRHVHVKRGWPIVAISLAVFLLVLVPIFVVSPDYDSFCAPFHYYQQPSWGGIPCRFGIVNHCADAIGQSPISLSTDDATCSSTAATRTNDDTPVLGIFTVVDQGSCSLDDLTMVNKQLLYPQKSCDATTVQLFESEDGAYLHQLQQFHFHFGGSEHVVDNIRHGGEMHLVHHDASDSDGSRQISAVVAVFLDALEDENDNEYFEPILQRYEQLLTATTTVSAGRRRLENAANHDYWNAYNLLPATENYFYYRGSLTTPPCTPGVHWFVLQQSLVISSSQLHRLELLYVLLPTYRYEQDKAGRKVLRSCSDWSDDTA